MNRLLPLVAALLAGVVSPVAAADWPLPSTTPAAAGFSADRLATLHHSLAGAVDAGKYSGYVSLIARDGKIVDWQVHGWQDIEAKTPMAKDSIVRIFSMSKIITSVGVLM